MSPSEFQINIVVGWRRIFLLAEFEGFWHDLGSVTELT